MPIIKKINPDHYVVVSDEPIEEGDWIYWNNKFVLAINTSYNGDTKKVTHSTQPIEQYYSAGSYINTIHKKVEYIPLEYIKSLVGEVDIEKKAQKYATNSGMMAYVFPEKKEGFIAGYNECLEDKKDKLYTFVDMQLFGAELIEKFEEGQIKTREDITNLIRKYDNFYYNDWDCEFIDGQLKLK